MYRGFIKLWRKTQYSAVFQNEGLLKVFLWCLMRAAYKESFISVSTGRGVSEVKLSPGSFLFGRDSAAKELHMPPTTVWKRMMKLKNLEFCDIESNSHLSIVSIKNWNTYQVDQEKGDSERDRQGTGKEHKEEVKKDKNNTHASDFLIFWKAYPKKKSKLDAEKAWKSMREKRPPMDVLLSALERQKESKDWLKESGKYIPFPATWLRAGSWEDETEIETIKPKGSW